MNFFTFWSDFFFSRDRQGGGGPPCAPPPLATPLLDIKRYYYFVAEGDSEWFHTSFKTWKRIQTIFLEIDTHIKDVNQNRLSWKTNRYFSHKLVFLVIVNRYFQDLLVFLCQIWFAVDDGGGCIIEQFPLKFKVACWTNFFLILS